MSEYNDVKNAVEKLEIMQKKMAAYNHATGLLYFDSVTVAPKDTTAGRGQTMGILTEESYKVFVNDETPKLLEYLNQNEAQLDEKIKLQVKKLDEDYKKIYVYIINLCCFYFNFSNMPHAALLKFT